MHRYRNRRFETTANDLAWSERTLARRRRQFEKSIGQSQEVGADRRRVCVGPGTRMCGVGEQWSLSQAETELLPGTTYHRNESRVCGPFHSVVGCLLPSSGTLSVRKQQHAQLVDTYPGRLRFHEQRTRILFVLRPNDDGIHGTYRFVFLSLFRVL